MKYIISAFVLLTVCAGGLAQDRYLKKAAFAGLFYDAERSRLETQVDGFIAAHEAAAPTPGRVIGLIAPHAGYVYSGRTAGAAYARVKGGDYETVVVIGPSHQVGFSGCSVWPEGRFETPLGALEVDRELAGKLSAVSGFKFSREAFEKEHSVEVQLPFIQRALPSAKIVPVVMGFQTRSTIRRLASALEKACRDRKVLVVASTDLSHYLPKRQAEEVDAGTIKLVKSLDTESIIRAAEAGENFMCGAGPVASVLLYASGVRGRRVEILERSDSSASGGPVVGYLAAVVLAENGREEKADNEAFNLTPQEKTALLKLARSAIEQFLATGRIIADNTGLEALRTPRGAFVTLEKNGDLRGCIGFTQPVGPLGETVINAAVYAAVRDPRFPPVRREELAALRIEVSVLTPLKEITDTKMVKVGRHGLLISKNGRSGLLLPQVAAENGWDRLTFLEQTCLKAGLDPNDWRRGARIYVFEAVVFGE